ncbi:hypothetical protein TNCV_1000231 [Trichonephila clavipes]|nr:hypothetical protein TNCV_1000231 [Trichonephila clavipes]
MVPLIQLNQSLNGNGYVQLFGDYLHPFMDFISPNKYETLMDGNASCQRARNDSALPRYCGLSFWKIGSRVGQNQTTVMRICDRWMQKGMTERRGRSPPPQCTTSRGDK